MLHMKSSAWHRVFGRRRAADSTVHPWSPARRKLACHSQPFAIAFLVGTLLLVACGVAEESATSPHREPLVQQPALRPRAATAATTTPSRSTEPASPATATSPDAPTFVQVAVGENHSCALQSSGRVQCWGANDDGQLDVPKGVSFQQITAGHQYSCGIRANGGVTCWGRNDHGQLDAPDGQFTAVDAGWDHICALSGTDAICWGWNANERATPPTDTAFAAIGAGAEHSCGLSSTGDLICWGKNNNGQADPRRGPFRTLAVGIAHTCVLDNDNMVLCQGENASGQSSPPQAAFTQISSGSDHTCGLLPTRDVVCWGGGQSKAINVRLGSPPGPFSSISAGWRQTCALTDDGRAQCWNYEYLPIPFPPYDRLQFTDALPGYTLNQPTDVFPWPQGGLAVVDREGSIRTYIPGSDPHNIFDLEDAVASDGSLNGLLSAELDPEFAEFPFLYVFYTIRRDTEGQEESAILSRFQILDGRIKRNDELIIMEIPVLPRPTDGYDGANHYGGAIRFGPDGMMYLGIGDSTCFKCPQSLESLHGKIIRIDVRGASAEQPYRIPRDNPMLAVPDARPEIWAYGLRNPWRMAFDLHDGSLWVADVGHDAEEEVSIATAGANLGWPIFEGSDCLDFTDEVSRFYGIASGYQCSEVEDVTAPIISYELTHATCAIIGGVVYRGAEISWLQGLYLFGDFCSGQVWALNPDADEGRQLVQIADLNLPLSSFGTDADGEVYALTFGGPILRLVEADPGSELPVNTVATETITPSAQRSP